MGGRNSRNCQRSILPWRFLVADRSSIDVVHQPLGAHHVVVDLHVERRLGDAAAGERGLVDEHDVGEVENVVDQQLIVALDVSFPAPRSTR